MLTHLSTAALLAIALYWVSAVTAQETPEAVPKEPLPRPADIQAKLREWVGVKKMISEEQTEWAAEKATLSELNDIRRREIEQINEFNKAAGERVDELSEKKAAFKTESEDLKKWRRNLEKRIEAQELRLRPLLSQFPPPLKDKVSEATIRLDTADPQAPLQNRTRDVLLITQVWMDFQNSITVDTELREIDGQKREVDVLYLGMTQAYYVDRSGRFGGFGKPAAEGWNWTEENSLAPRIRLALDVHARSETPQFVNLPIGDPDNKPE